MKNNRMVGDGLDGITIGKGICNRCIHVSEDGQSCKAFPKGIPADILSGKIDHHKPYSGDYGIQYKGRENAG